VKAEVNGAALELVERGTGEPVVLVHGSASDYRTWDAQLEELGKRFRAMAYSRRYHYPNRPIPEDADYSMREHVDDLSALLSSRAAAPAHLVGHSYGGFVCLLLAIQEPGLVRSLVLAEPPVIPLFLPLPPKPSALLKLLLRKPQTAIAIIRFVATGIAPATAAARRDDAKAATRCMGRAILGHDSLARLAEPRLQQAQDNFIKAELLGSGLPPLEREDVRRIQTPTLLLTGARSPRLFHRLTDGLQDLLPHAECAEIPSASHIIHEDSPAAYNGAVLSFLARH